MSRSDSGPKLAGGIQTASGCCSQNCDPNAYENSDDPRHERCQTLNREAEPDKEYDDRHAKGLGCE